MVTVCKRHHIGDNMVVITASSVLLDSHPPEKGIVRADAYIGGYIVKKISDNMCKMTFCIEMDIKLNMFLARSVAPKTAHLSLSVRNYALK